MPFKDIDIFLQAASAVLQGRDPYAIPNLEVFYPLPFYFIFIPLVALPLPVVHALWTALQAVILVALLRQRALIAIFAVPVFLSLLLGQVDVILLGLFKLLQIGIGGGIALAFLVLKPQLVLLLAPWMLWQWSRHDRRQIMWFGLVFGTLVIGSLLVQPDWPMHMLARSGERTRAAISSSLWGLLSVLPPSWWLVAGALASGAAVVWSWRKSDVNWTMATGLLISPYIFSYNLVPLLAILHERRWLVAFTVLSWVAFAMAAWQSNDRASASLTVMTLVFLRFRRGSAT